MVHNEPAGRPQTPRPDMCRTVAVARKDKQFCSLGRGNDLVLDPSTPLHLRALPPQALGGGRQQLPCRGGGLVRPPGTGIVAGLAGLAGLTRMTSPPTPQQPRKRTVRDPGHILTADVQQHDLRPHRRIAARRIHTRRPSALADPDDDRHAFILLRLR